MDTETREAQAADTLRLDGFCGRRRPRLRPRPAGPGMKPPVFDYVAPATLDEAIAALADAENGAVLAGGQSLLPTLNFRIAQPDRLVDLRRIAELRGIAVEDGWVAIRAMARQREVELSDAVQAAQPLVRETLQNVAHVPIRNRGTVVGSIAHADAAAELPALLLLTEGAVVVAGPRGRRTIAAADFFRFHMTTSREPDEIATEVRLPALAPDTGWSFREFTRRHGDYAIAGVGVLLTLDGGGTCRKAALAACGVAPRPVRLERAEQAVLGRRPDAAVAAEAGRAAADHVAAPDDAQATTGYRRQLLAELVERTVAEAAGRARRRMQA